MAKIYGDRWKIVSNISGGGQGDVYRVTDKTGELSGEWAMKRLRRKDRIGRFRQEVEILRRLQHENIITLVDAQVVEDGGDDASFLVMPIAQYGDLDTRLGIYTGHMDSIIQVATQIARALEYAHAAKVIHRDVKPGNILFPQVGHKVWVADFGLSLDQTAERNTPDGEIVGPRFFIAPELDEGGALNVTPAADIYSLGQLIFYMLSGGRRITRENVFDQRYAEFFAKGPRHVLLRLLLNKMVAPLATRYAKMDVVIRELEQIENWEQTAVSGLLDTRGLAAAGRLQKRAAEEIQRKATFDEVRTQDIQRIQNVSESVSAWLSTQLEATKAQIGAGDVLIVRVAVNETAGQRRPLQVDTGSNTLLEERANAAIRVRLPNDSHRRTYVLRLVVCAEVQYTLPLTNPNYLGAPGNPRMAVLPFFSEFTEHSPHLNNESGYIFGKSTKYGVPDPIPIFPTPAHYGQLVSHNYQEGSMAIARFNAADWPAAQADIVDMTKDVLSRMMQYIGEQSR
jgi:serine/threonine protein kinase